MANNEWSTPPKFIEAARSVIGTIDLDPATNLNAQELVQAKAYYTQEMDGLQQHWQGKVFLNPPYSRGLAKRFMTKLVEHYLAGDVDQVLVFNS